MEDKCPNCGESFVKSERLKKQYCPSCGYQIKFEDLKAEDAAEKTSEEKLTIQEKEEMIHTEEISKKIDKELTVYCPECGGEYAYEDGEITCRECGKNHETASSRVNMKNYIKPKEEKTGFICPNCGEKYSVINGEIYCKKCDDALLKDRGKVKKDKAFEYECPKCKGQYAYDETTGKIACEKCGYQPFIENKENVIDEDNSPIKSIECDKCGSNAGYYIAGDKYICKSCGDEIDKELIRNKKLRKVIDNDGVVAKRLSTKVIECKNCGGRVEGFDLYKTEFCPNCGTINVVIEDMESLRVEPNKIVPYLLNKDDCQKAIYDYSGILGAKIKIKSQWRKIYIPFWLFHYEGAKVWFRKKKSFVDKAGRIQSFILESGKEEIKLNDVWVSGREEFQEETSFDLDKIDLSKAVEYAPEILDTLTERYNVGTTEASVIAEDAVYDYLYDCIWNQKKNLKTLWFNDLELDYGTYKNEFQQILIPTWQSICEIKNEDYFVCINGQNGEVKIAGFGRGKKAREEKDDEISDETSNLVEGVIDILLKLP